EQLAEDNQVAALSPPNIDPAKIDIPKEGPLVYEFDVEVRPEFELPPYKGMRLKRPVRQFSDKDVIEEERRILSRYGQLVPKEQGSPAEVGDHVVVDMTSRYTGVSIGNAKEITIRVEPRVAFRDGVSEDFGERVVGAKAGDTRVVTIKLSDAAALEQL